jgi:rod shape-determining protein MreD
MAQEIMAMGEAEKRPRAVWLAPLSVMLGSLAVIVVPVIATVPYLPPFGLMMLLGWRVSRANALPVWAPVPLGFFDDLVSGQPLGSAMVLWPLAMLAVDVLDTRLVWRDFWQDWLIAAGAVAFCLAGGRLLASPFAAHVDTALLLQILIAVMLLPLVVRLCAWLDRDARKD